MPFTLEEIVAGNNLIWGEPIYYFSDKKTFARVEVVSSVGTIVLTELAPHYDIPLITYAKKQAMAQAIKKNEL